MSVIKNTTHFRDRKSAETFSFPGSFSREKSCCCGNNDHLLVLGHASWLQYLQSLVASNYKEVWLNEVGIVMFGSKQHRQRFLFIGYTRLAFASLQLAQFEECSSPSWFYINTTENARFNLSMNGLYGSGNLRTGSLLTIAWTLFSALLSVGDSLIISGKCLQVTSHRHATILE